MCRAPPAPHCNVICSTSRHILKAIAFHPARMPPQSTELCIKIKQVGRGRPPLLLQVISRKQILGQISQGTVKAMKRISHSVRVEVHYQQDFVWYKPIKKDHIILSAQNDSIIRNRQATFLYLARQISQDLQGILFKIQLRGPAEIGAGLWQ